MLCRLCIFECTADDSFDINNDKKEPDVKNIISKYLSMQISQNDEVSTKICSNCLKHLKDFDEFFDFVKRRQNVMEAVYFGNENACEFAADSPANIECVNAEAAADDLRLDCQEANFGDEITETIEFSREFDNYLITDIEDDMTDVMCTEQQARAQKGNETNTHFQNSLSSKVLAKKSKKFVVRSHLEITDERDKFIEDHVQLKCKICRDVLDTFKNFQRHFRIKHKCPAYIKCCGSRFYSRQQMIKHIQSHVNPDLFKCQICNKTLSSRKNLDSHIASFHTDKEKLPHVCDICGDRFTTSFILRTHMIVHEDGNTYTCEICKKSFKHLRSVKRHKRLQHGTIMKHVCELCGKNYKYKQIFEQHMADKHNIISKETMKYCEECKIWFSTKYYKKHAERHELKDVDCKHCGKIYPSKATLNKHLDSHYHRKKCHTCGSTFDHAKDLREHMETHVS